MFKQPEVNPHGKMVLFCCWAHYSNNYVVKELLVGFPIYQLFFPEILNPPIILEIIPTKINLLTRIYAKFLIARHKENYIQLQIIRHEMLTTATIAIEMGNS